MPLFVVHVPPASQKRFLNKPKNFHENLCFLQTFSFGTITMWLWASSSPHLEGDAILQGIRNCTLNAESHVIRLAYSATLPREHKSCNIVTYNLLLHSTLQHTNHTSFVFCIQSEGNSQCSQDNEIWYGERHFVWNANFQILKVTNMALD